MHSSKQSALTEELPLEDIRLEWENTYRFFMEIVFRDQYMRSCGECEAPALAKFE